MSSKTENRIIALLSSILVIAWLYPTIAVYSDYKDLLTQTDIVKLSILTLWVPIGGLGFIVVLIVSACTTLYTGKTTKLLFGERWLYWVNKICLYSAIAGIPFAIGWTYHSLNLLDKYGYEYSDNLTRITPTGIHLIYVKSKN